MSAYITKDDLIPEYLTQQEAIRMFADKATTISQEPADVDVTGILNPVILAVSEEMDGYLRRHYTVPISPVPPSIKKLCCRLMIYEGKRRRSAITVDDREDHKEDLRWLERAAEGK